MFSSLEKKNVFMVLLESIIPYEPAYKLANGQEKKLPSLQETKNTRNMKLGSSIYN